MSCKTLSSLEGCSQCKIFLISEENAPLLEPLSMIDIVDEILKQCSSFPNNKLVATLTTISCTGNISIVYENRTNQSNSTHNKLVCYKIINNWLKHNIELINRSMDVMYLILCACILNCNESEQKIVSVLDAMHKVFTYIKLYTKQLNKY